MKRRIPRGLNTRENLLRSNAASVLRNHGWGQKDKQPERFNIPILCEWMGLDPENAKNQRMVYHQVILIWRKMFTAWFKDLQFRKELPLDMNRYEIWDTVINNYNQNDKYLFFAKRESTTSCYFVQPSLSEMENMDLSRIGKQLKSVITILEEMNHTGERRLSGRNVKDLLEDTNKVKQVYLEDGRKFKKKRLDIVDEKRIH